MSLFNKLVVATLPIVPKAVVKLVAQRYIAGPMLTDAVHTSKALKAIGASSTIDVLGEFVTDRERASNEAEMSKQVVDAIQSHSLDAYLSVKLTSLGLDLDRDFAFEKLTQIVEHARKKSVFVRMDMENTPYTDVTLDFYRKLRANGYDNVGVVIQAYLRRSENDVQSLLEYQPSVRLCKGIYVESEQVAYKDADDIRASYKALLRLLVDGNANVRIATHDEALIADAEQLVEKQKLDEGRYQFQMLLGVRERRRDAIIAKGHPMCVYVPFGEDWYGYSTRRLKENPQIAGHVARAFLTGKAE